MVAGPVDAVIFDLGGVLIDWDPRYLYARIFPDRAEMETFLATVLTAHWHAGNDAGIAMADRAAELARAFPEHEAAIAAFDTRWDETFAGAFPETVALLERLDARGVPLYAITNWPGDKFPRARARFEFLARFRDIVVSGEERIRKPDPAIFHLATARFGIDPARTLFIDDHEPNVIAARALGFHVHHHAGASGLAARLAGLDLI